VGARVGKGDDSGVVLGLQQPRHRANPSPAFEVTNVWSHTSTAYVFMALILSTGKPLPFLGSYDFVHGHSMIVETDRLWS
jgi:hypothetical protein